MLKVGTKMLNITWTFSFVYCGKILSVHYVLVGFTAVCKTVLQKNNKI